MKSVSDIDQDLARARTELGGVLTTLHRMNEDPPLFAAASSEAAWRGVERQLRETLIPKGDAFLEAFRRNGDLSQARKAAIVYAECYDLAHDVLADSTTLTGAAYMRQLGDDIGSTIGDGLASAVNAVGEAAAGAVAGAAKGLFSGSGGGTLFVLALVALALYARARALKAA